MNQSVWRYGFMFIIGLCVLSLILSRLAYFELWKFEQRFSKSNILYSGKVGISVPNGNASHQDQNSESYQRYTLTSRWNGTLVQRDGTQAHITIQPYGGKGGNSTNIAPTSTPRYPKFNFQGSTHPKAVSLSSSLSYPTKDSWRSSDKINLVPTISSINFTNGIYSPSHQNPLSKQKKSSAFNDPIWCKVNCAAGTPCEYLDEVNLRIIVMTFNRPSSLQMCLNSVLQLQTIGDAVSVEIWVDRSKTGDVSEESLRVAHSFQSQWQKDDNRRACVHFWQRNVGITGQWTDTWRPRENTQELAIILEDDIDISSFAYKWLKAVHAKYGHRKDISGYTLQMKDVNFFAGRQGAMKGPPGDTVFMYGVLGTWGFCPHPANWRLYQTWSHKVRESKAIKPYVEGIVPTEWYKIFEKSGREDTMWEMWHIYFSHINHLYCVYCNLVANTGRQDVMLSWNRKEAGLHYDGRTASKVSRNLMVEWKNNYIAFPQKTIQFWYNGIVARRV